MAKLPAFQFYPGDWMKDPSLRSCSYAARGLWTDMLCLMFENDRRGYLQLNGNPVSTAALARMTGGAEEEVSRLLQELESSGVFSRTAHGMIYSRRQVRDEDKRQKCAEAGKLGGNPTLIRQSKGGPKGDSKGEPNPQPTPSSSTSSSSSDKDRVSECAGVREAAADPIGLIVHLAKRDLSTSEQAVVWRDYDAACATDAGDIWLASARQMAQEPNYTFGTVGGALKYLNAILNRCRDDGTKPGERVVRLAATGPPDTDTPEEIRAIVAEATQRGKKPAHDTQRS